MGIDLAATIKLASPGLPVALVTDAKTGEKLDPKERELFMEVIDPGELPYSPNLVKMRLDQLSPFDRTLFIDSDCVIRGSLLPLFEHCENRAVQFQGELLEAKSQTKHQGISVEKIVEGTGVEKYLKTNSGWFYFEKGEKCREFFTTCREMELHLRSRQRIAWRSLKTFMPDEYVIGLAGGKLKVSPYSGPHPMPWYLSEQEAFKSQYIIWHLISKPLSEIWDVMMKQIKAARKEAGLPCEATQHEWEADRAKLLHFARLYYLLKKYTRKVGLFDRR